MHVNLKLAGMAGTDVNADSGFHLTC